jgi:hypothetical protein
MSNTLEDNQQYRRFLDERRSLNDARFKVAETLDKALLTLSGGALGISMTFVKDIAKNPTCKYTLIGSWILFGLTIASILLSLYFCQAAYKKQREILDDEQIGKKNTKNNKWSIVTKALYFIAIVSFLFGLLLLGIFIVVNM